MFANFIKNIVIQYCGTYLEVLNIFLVISYSQDLNTEEIIIDKWNGQIVKDYVGIKKNALESLCLYLLGAPVTVVKGYAKKVKVDVPWNKLMSKPVEIYADEVHIILRSSPTFDISFAKKMIRQEKMEKVQELLH